MADKRCKWDMENLEKALQDVMDNQMSVRAAAKKYEVPKSTLHDHLKSYDTDAKPGPAPITDYITWGLQTQVCEFMHTGVL